MAVLRDLAHALNPRRRPSQAVGRRVTRRHAIASYQSLRGRLVRCAVVAGTIAISAGFGPFAAVARQQPARTPDIFFVPTRSSVADAMLKLARVGPNDVVYDLGSGDGRIPILAAQKYGARGVGIELDPKLVEMSRQVAREGGVSGRVTFIEGDLFTADISAATVVTLYLSTNINLRLAPKLREELRPGTRVVSHQFGLGRWAPIQTVRADDGTDLFLWTIPAR